MEDNKMLELDENKYLTFAIGEDAYGIAIDVVDDIIGIQDVTYVPSQPAYLKGVINLRGQIIPVIDIRLRFYQEAIDYDDRTCIVVIKMEDMPVGVVVDRVLEVVNIAEVTVPSTFEDKEENFLTGIGKHGDQIVLLVDCQSLLMDLIV
ncbi:purine-binding chemotaxis protein CheW [Acidaminobacter sp. JC074]|uniref:chemotaxis protein CheW n=1 Tax=Acidaminobacter sp. JC074 TaxID=2530199 RepID=UPI001F115C15|nr:chemotaxis protein CheW [Acidaminobacter sp. JC074]MCH4890411.1 purine-binding chemotaxis protein CheW [Acidaminobacter sp. JC074]